MISTIRLVTSPYADIRRDGRAAFSVFEPARGCGSPPVGMLARFADLGGLGEPDDLGLPGEGGEGGWHAYVQVGPNLRRYLGEFLDPPAGGPTGREAALRAIAKAL